MKWWQKIIYLIIETLTLIYGVVFQHVRFQYRGHKIPKGPIFVLSNHHSNWDPLYLAPMFYLKFIRFIAHDELFQNKFYSLIIKTCLGQVRRGMDEADPKPIFDIIRIAKKGGSVGLFPEGDIDMFGRTLPIEKSVAKLAKTIKLPLVLTRITGAHLRAPRWSKLPYASKITYGVTDVISPHVIETLSVDELYERILKGIQANEMLYQEKAKITQIGFGRAEWLELGLFMCPKCQSLESLHSKNNTLTCSSCDFRTRFNRHSFFTYPHESYFKTTTSWDDWQKNELLKKIPTDPSAVFLVSPLLAAQQCSIGEYFDGSIFDYITLKLYNNKMIIQSSSNKDTLVIKLDDIKYAQLRFKDVLEIRYQNTRYRFFTSQIKWSAYLWKTAINMLKQLQLHHPN